VIARDSRAEARLYDALRAQFGKDDTKRTDVHLSALLNPMQTHWQNVLGRPPLTNSIKEAAAQIGVTV
jgi:hypothetical protein